MGQLCTAKSELSQGMVLEIIPLKERIDHDPIEMPLTIAYEDEDILIVDKASGITMNFERTSIFSEWGSLLF